HVGDVQQAVDAAEVDERAVVGDVLDRAAQDLPLGQRLERGLLLLGVLLFEERLVREDDVAALLVDLDDAHAELLPLQRSEVPHGTHVDLRAGEERADADVHREAALDPLDDAADDDLPLGVGLLDLVPDLHLLGLLARQHDVAFAILRALEQHVDQVAALHGHLAALVEEFVDGNQAFCLVADVDDDRRLGHLQHGALHDLAFRHVAEAVVIDVEHGRELLRIHVLVVHRLEGRTGGLPSPGARRCSGLFTRLVGRDQPVFNIRHSLRVLLNLITGFCCLSTTLRGCPERQANRLRGPAPRSYNGETNSGGWLELVCQLLPSPISTRLYDTYPETVKVSRRRKGRPRWPDARPQAPGKRQRKPPPELPGRARGRPLHGKPGRPGRLSAAWPRRARPARGARPARRVRRVRRARRVRRGRQPASAGRARLERPRRRRLSHARRRRSIANAASSAATTSFRRLPRRSTSTERLRPPAAAVVTSVTASTSTTRRAPR